MDLRDVLNSDAQDLEGIRASTAEREKSETESAYSVAIGLGKTVLAISTREVSWGAQRFPVDSISRIRWGAIRHSVNGIPTGTTHTIAFGAGAQECVVTTRNRKVYDAFTARLWRVCGVPLAVRMLSDLREGKTLSVGNIRFTDEHVELNKTKLFGKAEDKVIRWADAQTWSENGEFRVSQKGDRSFVASASYINHANTHVLANMVGMAFDRGLARLSNILS